MGSRVALVYGEFRARGASLARSWINWLEALMAEQLFLYGVYSIHVRPIELNGARWDAEYEIRHREKAVKTWTTVGGDEGYADEAEAIANAHQRAVDDIEHGAGIPKPKAFP